MITQQFRPKYSVETYPLIFSFSSSVQHVPVVSVEVLYGNDPDKDTLIGLTRVYKNIVLSIISGGVPGCVYGITCTVDEETISGTVAVLPTEVPAPSGGGFPLTDIYTTPPYPGFYEDSLSASFSVTAGALTKLVQLGLILDSIDTEFGPTGGSLFIVPPAISEDALNTSFGPTGGSLEDGIFGVFEDSINSLCAPTGGALFAAPQGTFIDSINTTFGPTGGSLGVP